MDQDRFARAATIHPKPVGAGLVGAFALLAMPVIVILFVGTPEIPMGRRVLSAIFGLLIAILVVAAAAWFHFSIEDPGNSAALVFPSFRILTSRGQPSPFWSRFSGFLDRLLPSDFKGRDRGYHGCRAASSFGP
jgi:hypothetical protein